MLSQWIKSLALALVVSFAVGTTGFAAPQSGEAAPEFSLKGSDGKTYKLSDFKNKVVVLEWFNKDCPYVRKFYDTKTMQELQKDAVGKEVVWLSIISSAKGKEGFMTAEQANKYRSENAVANTAILFDADGSVGKLYGAKTTPHMFVINKEAKVAYQGAIDDKPSADQRQIKGATNYVSAALAALTSKDKAQTIKTTSTAPYGCSVKY